jgi:hypothetical protein
MATCHQSGEMGWPQKKNERKDRALGNPGEKEAWL